MRDIATTCEISIDVTRRNANCCAYICKKNEQIRRSDRSDPESEPHPHRLHLQANAKAPLDSSGNLAGERQYVRCAGSATIDERQRVPRRNDGSAPRVALGETGLLNQPGCRNLDLARILCVRTGGKARGRLFAGGRNLPELLISHHWILEEAARAAAIGGAQIGR